MAVLAGVFVRVAWRTFVSAEGARLLLVVSHWPEFPDWLEKNQNVLECDAMVLLTLVDASVAVRLPVTILQLLMPSATWAMTLWETLEVWGGQSPPGPSVPTKVSKRLLTKPGNHWETSGSEKKVSFSQSCRKNVQIHLGCTVNKWINFNKAKFFGCRKTSSRLKYLKIKLHTKTL